MRRSPHVPNATLHALILRSGARVPPREVEHLLGCKRCRAELEDHRLLHDVLKSPLEEPSAGTIARACALMVPRLPSRSLRSRFRIARLVYDSEIDAPRFGIRGLEARHQVWQTALVDIDVRIAGGGIGARPSLVGQVLPRGGRRLPDDAGFVGLVERGRSAEWVGVGSQGEFVLPAPRGRRWTLWLEWGQQRLQLVTR